MAIYMTYKNDNYFVKNNIHIIDCLCKLLVKYMFGEAKFQ